MQRQIIRIDDEKCNGCGLCIPNCPEGALQIIDGKARLVSDLFCDGLGACIGHCPEGAITIEEREAGEYDERRVIENVARQGENTVKAHLEHLREHGQHDYMKEAISYLVDKDLGVPEEFIGAVGVVKQAPVAGCPGCQVVDFRETEESADPADCGPVASELRQWPVQIMLVPTSAPYLQNADLLITADCVPFAYAGYHRDFLRGKVLLVGCPKLDDAAYYREKLTEIFKLNDIKSITVVQMEVPCCFGLMKIVKAALDAAEVEVPVENVVIGVKGERLVSTPGLQNTIDLNR
jgi:ferredoxin